MLNEKSFNYGDVISLVYNSKISIPAIINGNNVLGNIDGKVEYFKITKNGLEKVNFGDKAYTNNVTWSNGELNIKLDLATGNTISLENGLIEIVDSSNKIVATRKFSKGLVQIEKKELDKLTKDESYTFKIKVDNKDIPINISSNTESYGNYKLFGDSYHNLCIKVEKPKVIINNENDIKSYSEVVNDEISKKITSNEEIVDSLTNEKMMTDIIANAFINRFGLKNIQSFYRNNTNNTRFVSWLLNNNVAMSEYLQATNISESNINGLQIWSDIWNTYTNSHYGFNLKLAMATALATQTKITDCFNGKPIGSPVERYNIFETLNEEGGMVKGFENLNIKLLKAVVNVPITNPQIREMRALILQNHNNLVSGNHLPTADYTINYNFRNPYNGASIFGSWADFYGKDETVADVFKIGGVCGSISRIGSIACRVFGQPAHQMGEPGHDAFYSYNIQKGNWSSQYGETEVANATGFDVSNWSNGLALNGNVVTYTDLYADANNENLVKSNKYLWIASSSIPYDLKLKAINEAIKTQPLNVEAWLFKINLLNNNNNNVSADEYIDLSNDIMKSLKDYPEPMFDLLVKFNRNMIQVCTTSQYNDFVKKIKAELNDINKNGNANEKVQSNRILTEGYLEKYGFVENQVKILGKININSWNRNSPTDSLVFESNGKIKVDALHTWIGTNEKNSGISIKIFSSNMKPLKEVNTSGTDFGTNKIANSFNNSKFNIGDIIEIVYKPGLASNGYLTLENNLLKTSKISNTIAVQVTKDGLNLLDGKYIAPNGKEYNFHTGFIKDSNGTKYEIFGEYQKGMQFIDNKWYYFNENGLMQIGLQTIDNSGYYFNKDGVLQTGWQSINGEKYYFSENGKATPGYKTIDGKKYLFANNGLEIQNIIPNSQMKIISYSTEQNKKEYSANNIIDGKLNDNWQNIWNRSDKNPYVTIELDHPYNLNELVCFPRQDGGWNGDIEEYKILVSIDGKNFKEAASGKWIYSTSNESQYANLNGVKAKYIKIESKKGIYDLATIAEVILSGTDINKSGLKDEIAKAKEKLNEVNGYTEESINNLKDAISKGEKALGNKNITQEQINSLTSSIENSIKDLKADKSALQEALNKANNIVKNEDQYTELSIKSLKSFIIAGESVMNNNKVTPIQVKAATISILSGINGLEANKTNLQEALNKADELLKSSDSYTKDSVNKLKESVEKADSLMNNKKVTPKEVKEEKYIILNAINGLKKLPVVMKLESNKNTDKDKDSGNVNTGKLVDNTEDKKIEDKTLNNSKKDPNLVNEVESNFKNTFNNKDKKVSHNNDKSKDINKEVNKSSDNLNKTDKLNILKHKDVYRVIGLVTAIVIAIFIFF
ncbi:discoidin domain-containing protein [Clostridium perfringens]|uniref:discoidin domain-containing protein n=1 Tax=Clostridium perfringens TaxID=1502 RepID=UPI0024BCD3FD|nr:discoidin domain-containing protein [Clostridium perfringens]